MKKLMLLATMPLLFVMSACNNEEYEPKGPMAYGHEYVDLGLSVKWATMNVGANRPEGYGDYYAWGEVEVKDTYTQANYKWWNADKRIYTKYTKDIYKAPILEKEDDVAAVKWGGEWRMPTIQEFRELLDNCETYYDELNGVPGYRFVSEINGNSIFLPAAGDGDSDKGKLHEWGNYYTSTLSFRTDRSEGVYFWSISIGYIDDISMYRFEGNTIRPVLP